MGSHEVIPGEGAESGTKQAPTTPLVNAVWNNIVACVINMKAAYRAERDTMLRTRLHGLWLLRCGRRLGEVASVVGIHYRTVQTWVSWYRKGGVEEVLSHRMKGKGQPGFLSEEQERELAEEVESGRFRTAGEIREWIESEYGVSYRSGSVYSLLERLGCSPKVPRGLHVKADVGAQESWKRGA